MPHDPSLDATQLGTTRVGATQLGVTQLGSPADFLASASSDGEPPRTIGRFAVLRTLGVGGMGVVYAAYDEELDRRVAIKLLQTRGGVESSQGHTRLLREAQAMARLSHPNIATVFEVGLWSGQVFIAMEFVAGPSLGGWLAVGPRGWSEVLQVFTQAGRGLAAAHASGIVHRDFKPDNAIVGDDGRVRVLDFGLARAAGDAASDRHVTTGADGSTGASALVMPLTMTGTVMGTPAYMAPEQHRGEATDARSDQFSFCVSLYEGLYGRRPFAGDTLAELVFHVLGGEIEAPPRERRVPGKIHAAVVRGLACEPERRWPSMTALLDALNAVDPARRRRRWFVGVGAAALLVGGAVGGLELRARSAARCGGAEAQLMGVWDDERRAQVNEALLVTGLPYAADTAMRVRAELDAYATTWVAGHRDACEATAVRQEQSEATRMDRMRCLTQRRQQLAALVDVLARADAAIVTQAVEAVHALPGAGACADLEYLAAGVRMPDDPAAALQVQALQQGLAVVRANVSAGLYRKAEAQLRPISEAAAALAHAPLIVEVMGERSYLLERLGRYAEAEAAGEQTYFAARVAGLEFETSDAARRLVTVVGDRLVRPIEGLIWARHALASLQRLTLPGAEADVLRARASVRLHESDLTGAAQDLQRSIELDEHSATSDPLSVASAARSLGSLREHQGKHGEAEALLRRALELRVEVLGAEHPTIAELHYLLGSALSEQGQHAEALAQFERALAMHVRDQGADHPWVGTVLQEIGQSQQAQGDLQRGLESIQRALVVLREALGGDHPDVGRAHNNLATALLRLDRREEGRRHLHEALEIYRARFGDSHADVAKISVNLGVLHKNAGDLDGAARHFARALDLLEARLGADHPTLGRLHVNLGNLRFEQRRHAEARAEYLRGIAILEAKLGPEHRDLAGALVNLANVERVLGESAAALAHAERALAILAAVGKVNPGALAEAAFAAARAVGRGDPRRARALGEQAREGFAAGGPANAKELKEVEQWLARGL